MQTGQFGNMLLLDDDPNLADSDKSYTEVSQYSANNLFSIQYGLFLNFKCAWDTVFARKLNYIHVVRYTNIFGL